MQFLPGIRSTLSGRGGVPTSKWLKSHKVQMHWSVQYSQQPTPSWYLRRALLWHGNTQSMPQLSNCYQMYQNAVVPGGKNICCTPKISFQAKYLSAFSFDNVSLYNGKINLEFTMRQYMCSYCVSRLAFISYHFVAMHQHQVFFMNKGISHPHLFRGMICRNNSAFVL